MNTLIKLICTLAGAVFGLAVSVAAVEVVRLVFSEINGTYYRIFAYPPPGGVLIGAIAAGIAAYRSSPDANSFARRTEQLSAVDRALLAGSAAWITVVAIAVFVGDLFGRYWDGHAWKKFWVLLLAPIILAFVSIPMVKWVKSAKKSDT